MNSTLVAKLRSAAQYRKEEVKNVFNSDIFGIAQSLSVDSKNLYHGRKSELLSRFETCSNQRPISSDNSGIVIDLSVVIQAKATKHYDTFLDFAQMLYSYISKGFKRCDIVCNRYFAGRLKEGIRDERGSKGSNFMFNKDTKFPTDFADNFLKNGQNKDNLNIFLVKYFNEIHTNHDLILVQTLNKSILSNAEDQLQNESIGICTSEEADARLIRHAINQSYHGIDEILIKSVDTDVLVLTRYGATKIFVEQCLGKHQKHYVIDIFNLIGEKKAKPLPFFHSFTGCDSTSSFFNHGKCQFWDTWMTNYEDDDILTEVFIELSDMPSTITQHQIDIKTKYVVKIYFSADSNAPCLSLADLRCKAVLKYASPNMKTIIPSKDGLIQHNKRAAFQAGWLWKECLLNPAYPNIIEWGWICHENKYFPKWCESYTNIDTVIISCFCKENVKCTRCKCSQSKLNCIEFCNCLRQCSK